jgi:hypothetical protein
MQIRIEASDFPGRSCGASPDSPGGYRDIHVGVQRRNAPDELLDMVGADVGSARWTLDCEVLRTPDGLGLRGRYLSGPPAGRFIYLSWLAIDDSKTFKMFRRAKLMLDAVPDPVLELAADQGLLVGRLGLTDPRGNPVCASVRPPVIEWTAEIAQPS